METALFIRKVKLKNENQARKHSGGVFLIGVFAWVFLRISAYCLGVFSTREKARQR